ncbi:F-box/kelch-repeat protein At3g23880-like [Lycium ferocissimum]|uniref:F-box/kelch-repeat protein At3g23880-like n=1 Tax=Lycium ferocissimum TaxID=112874 RepID=UPI002815D3B6|nr:F-box/kelch-repeat protein At3g23880-like [Lycium ferocissimum]
MQDSIFTIPILPPELIAEILARLLVKSLLKFRFVSKSWLGLISSPEFIKTHLSISANNKECTHHRLMMEVNQPNNKLKECSLSSLIYDESVIEASDLDYTMKNSGGYFRVVGFVNGLICLEGGTRNLFLWNPTIKKYKELPYYIRILKRNTKAIYGFGYDEFHDDYKVVCGLSIYQHGNLPLVEVKVYSLKSDSWKSMDDFEDGVRFRNSGPFLNGKLHWTTSCGLGKYSPRGPWGIISIDMADEKWEKIEPPCHGKKEEFGFALGVLGNNLSVLYMNYLIRINLWVTKEYGIKESWTKMYTIKCLSDLETCFHFPSCYMSKKGEILVLYGTYGMIHNQEDTPSVIKKIYNPKDDSISYTKVTNLWMTEIYIESLVCPLPQNQPRI